MEYVPEFKYLGHLLSDSGTDETVCPRRVVSGMKVAGAIRSLVNVRVFSLSMLGAYMRHCLYLFLCMVVRIRAQMFAKH